MIEPQGARAIERQISHDLGTAEIERAVLHFIRLDPFYWKIVPQHFFEQNGTHHTIEIGSCYDSVDHEDTSDLKIVQIGPVLPPGKTVLFPLRVFNDAKIAANAGNCNQKQVFLKLRNLFQVVRITLTNKRWDCNAA